ncbi:YihY/virulence factor BrkB family protein [Streptomyces sp. Ag109_O5-10]|uniref:YihY/virulence factor BrkB family protein n=1 Tax=Streptomyces sp. Ag109_O5-10 TaxID=1855349 RepID=UPI00089D8A1D|nr:YihY/virulence factor BrkB family protein [Streptomyces sp. Ag109_O5-10]SEF17287.1 membrane protein [Streptomyces sp. Ag109_O5-10]
MQRLRVPWRTAPRDGDEHAGVGTPIPRVPTPEEAGPGPDVERRAPDTPAKLPKRAWAAVLKGALREFKDDELADRAAALTYYGVLSLFPALLVLVSLLGIAGKSTIDAVLRNVRQLAPGAARDVATRAVEQLQGRAGAGSVMAVVGLVLALWSASGYVGAFIRAANTVYDMPEGRPLWKLLPLRVLITAALMVMAVISALIVVLTGGIARQAGAALGIGDGVLTAWSLVRWPVLVVLVTLMLAVLYWASPNAKVRGFRWITPGSLVALLVWLIASAGFAFYVAGFASYNKTYGTMAGVVVFLVWLWLTNLAVLLGLEFDAEAARQRAVAGGLPPGAEPYTEPRSTRTWDEEDARRLDDA